MHTCESLPSKKWPITIAETILDYVLYGTRPMIL